MQESASTSILIRRRGLPPAEIIPRWLDISNEWFGAPAERGPFRLETPEGWRVIERGPNLWRVVPARVNPDRRAAFQLIPISSADPAETWLRSVTIELSLETTFDPRVHAFPLRNSYRVLGDVLPSWSRFVRTYSPLPGPLARLLFRGLYSDVVFIREAGPRHGGLCSGMARWAGLRALRGETAQPPRDRALDEIAVIHGRQLADRALWAGFPWLLRASSRAAYRAVRRDALQHGLTLRALDVGVPKLWRRDFLTSIVGDGHTVVPYRIRQHAPERAFVDVYDPNRPPTEFPDEVHTIEFDLVRDRYAYRNKASLSESGVAVIAVEHSVYARRGSAILAVIGSAFWLAGKWLARRFRALQGQTTAIGE